MNRTIWKFSLDNLDDLVEIRMPMGAQIISVQLQQGDITLWAICDTTTELQNRKIWIVGTGNPLPDECSYENFLGSVQQGPLVWHLFEMSQCWTEK